MQSVQRLQRPCPRFDLRVTKPSSQGRLQVIKTQSWCGNAEIDEHGDKKVLLEEETPRPMRWNQPFIVIASCCIIIGVLGSGIAYAIR